MPLCQSTTAPPAVPPRRPPPAASSSTRTPRTEKPSSDAHTHVRHTKGASNPLEQQTSLNASMPPPLLSPCSTAQLTQALRRNCQKAPTHTTNGCRHAALG